MVTDTCSMPACSQWVLHIDVVWGKSVGQSGPLNSCSPSGWCMGEMQLYGNKGLWLTGPRPQPKNSTKNSIASQIDDGGQPSNKLLHSKFCAYGYGSTHKCRSNVCLSSASSSSCVHSRCPLLLTCCIRYLARSQKICQTKLLSSQDMVHIPCNDCKYQGQHNLKRQT